MNQAKARLYPRPPWSYLLRLFPTPVLLSVASLTTTRILAAREPHLRCWRAHTSPSVPSQISWPGSLNLFQNREFQKETKFNVFIRYEWGKTVAGGLLSALLELEGFWIFKNQDCGVMSRRSLQGVSGTLCLLGLLLVASSPGLCF